MEVSINYIAVFVASIVAFVIGFVWYAPPVFGKKWMTAMGLTKEKLDEQKKNGMTLTFVISFIGTLISAYVLAHFVGLLGVVDLAGALQLGFWIWLGFVLTTSLSDVLFGGRTKMALFIKQRTLLSCHNCYGVDFSNLEIKNSKHFTSFTTIRI
jgi:hypothetical protein